MRKFKKRSGKKLLLAIGAFFLCMPFGRSQDIIDLMNQENVQLEMVQEQANLYFSEVGKGKGSGYKLFKRWEHHARTRLQPDGSVMSAENMSHILMENRPMDGPKAISASDWEELGPVAWTNTSGYNPGVGRITTIAIEPVSQNIIYIGSPDGGLWKTTNAGSSWTPLGDGFDNMEIWAIEIDPTDVNTVYVGNSAGDVYKTTDGGTSFSLFYDQSSRITDILINPTDTDEIYVAIRYAGLFRTTDGGLSWTEVVTAGIEDVMYKPGSTSTIYACGNGFYRSTDGGVSFSNISSGIVASERMKLAVSPANTNYVYIVQKRGGGFGYLYRSTNSGGSFTVMSDYNDGNYIGSQGSRDMAIAVSNTNINEVHIGGFNMFISTNGGSTWTKECDWYYPSTVGGAYAYVHADIEFMQYIDGNIYVGSDGGIFKSTDAGDTFADLSTGLGIHQFYRINSSATDKYSVVGGSQDNGQNYMSGPSHSWVHWAGADGMDGGIHPTNANIVYGAYQYGTFRKSLDAGTTTTSMIQPPEAGSGNWVTPFAIDPNNGSRLYAGYTDLYRHDNSASTGSWVNTSSAFSFSGKLSHIELCPSNSDVIYVASYSTVYRSSNITSGSPTWTTLSGTSGSINDIAVDPYDEDRVVVVTSFGNVYESTDGGSSWTNINSGLPSAPMKTAVLDRSADQGIYVAIDGAVYYQNNATPGWELFSNNLPKMDITELDLYYDAVASDSRIRIGTYGRGLWESVLYDDDDSGAGAGGLSCATTISSFPYNQSFESGFGAWTQNGGDDFDWTRQSGTTISSGTGPSGADDGTYYIYTEVSSPNYPTKTAILTSPCFDLAGMTTPELSFRYHMLGSSVGTINLEASTDGSTWTSVWSQTGDQGSAWLSATVDLSAYTGADVKLRFNVTSGSGWQGDICIDKMSLIETGATLSCGTTITSYPYSQSFESGLGSWTQSVTDDFDWTRQSGTTTSSGTGPSGADDGTYYVYTEVSYPNYPSKTAVLTSPCYNLSGVASPYFNFSYQMLGTDVGTVDLEVSTDGTSWSSVWTKTGNQGSAWLSAAVNLSGYAGSTIKLRFNVTSGTSWQGDICVDKITLTDGLAPMTDPYEETDGDQITTNDWSIDEISVFPNPTSDLLQVQLSTEGEEVILTMVDLSGKTVSSNVFSTHNGMNLLKIHTGELAEGTYLLYIQKGDSKLTEKVIVRR